jgi:integrase/recombinase XerD
VFDWSPDVVDDWIRTAGLGGEDGRLDLFASERGTLVTINCVRQRFSRYCEELDLAPGLDLHSLRRSYATHLIEAGIDAKFVQDQLGHEYASTTGIYDCTSSDYRERTLRRALDSTVRDAMNTGDHDEEGD